MAVLDCRARYSRHPGQGTGTCVMDEEHASGSDKTHGLLGRREVAPTFACGARAAVSRTGGRRAESKPATVTSRSRELSDPSLWAAVPRSNSIRAGASK